jgi:aspartyl-tRNA(Asn)/glutamyl-tRNA(Gln) amidotransferase subunit C
MEITDQIIDKLANLARLKFEPTEKVAIKNDLQNMIGLIAKMDELDTTNVEPLLHMNDVSYSRADEVKNCITNAEAMLNAKINKAPHFIVPTVIKK